MEKFDGLNTAANAVVASDHKKGHGDIAAQRQGVETWPRAPWKDAIALAPHSPDTGFAPYRPAAHGRGARRVGANGFLVRIKAGRADR
ncbi:hypothetical protein [Caulobacter sp.]|uniref:hypothetical protein n=1 Tax=Caulobacter sp. TaxID=78 RepID=UPI001B2AEE63|nr:hypothetical protein [Caulobacter sp.]MBO9547284.1 hypothetical protein [Caulobacter sp.]